MEAAETVGHVDDSRVLKPLEIAPETEWDKQQKCRAAEKSVAGKEE